MNKEIPRNIRDAKEYKGIPRVSEEYKEMQKEHQVEHNEMRTYKEIPRNTTRFQGIRRDTTRFQGIQGNTKGALSKTEWYANVQRDSKEYNEM